MKPTYSLRPTDARGIAMITTLLVLMLMSALLVGFTTVVMSDQRYRFIDRDRGQAFYAASAGIEKLTTDLGNLFLENVAPTAAQVTALTAAAKMPVIAGITFTSPSAPTALPASQLTSYHCAQSPAGIVPAVTKTPTPVGTAGYTVFFCKSNTTNNPTVSDDNLVLGGTGAYSGMTALQTPYQIDVTAKTATGGEVHLSRSVQAVAIPVFQFGIFSEMDQSFFAGANFTMGGRIHTNGNLFLDEGPGATLTLTGRITAFKDVVRQFLSNGSSIDNGPTWTGTVSLATSAASPAGNRNMLRTEGSVVGAPGSAAWAGWQTVSLGASPANYNGYLRNGPTGASPGTGAKKLSLPLTAPGVGGSNVDVVRRPLAGEDPNGILYNERLFTKASIRILLSDTAADITSIPGVTAGAPISLETNWNVAANLPVGYGPITLSSAAAPPINRPPVALSPGAQFMNATNSANGGAGIINVTAATAPNFRQRFTLSNNLANFITCDTKANLSFTGCNGSLGNPGVTAALTLAQVSPAGNPIGLSALTASTTLGANFTITFATIALRDTFNFAPLPFYDTSQANGPVLITCTGTTITTYTGCSSIPNNSAVLVSGAMSDAGTSTLGGFIKIERNNADNSGWTDITLELLNYGFADQNDGGTPCGDPTPYAIVRLQRFRDNQAAGGGCNYSSDATGAKDPANWWPYVLYDAREGLLRDWDYPNTANAAWPATNQPSDSKFLTLGGTMYYVNIDVLNLQRWFTHSVAPYNVPASTGNLSKTDITGFSVYFSDRRNNRSAQSLETGEYGWEDFVNAAAANGVPNNGVDVGEDVNENNVQELYGGIPNFNAVYNSVPPCTLPATCVATYTAPTGQAVLTAATAKPQTPPVSAMVAQMNRPILFRRALMLTNGANIGANPVLAQRLTGLTIVSENPVYIKGNWNADIPAGTGFGGVNAATSVIADAVTLLSPAWTDANSFNFPYAAGNRVAGQNGWYRLAIIGGKGKSFPLPTAGNGISADFGTDGGAHNFLRFLQTWGGQTMNYLGSMATLYYNRQAVGTYKCCNTVYGPPTRAYNFDVNFLNPALLPPLTPMFRDLNVIGFSQELRPGR